MNLRKVLIGTTIALALIVPTTVFAATSTTSAAIKIRGLFGIDSSKLTSAQLADVKDYAQKMADLQKSLIDKMVSNGSMTQAQADAQKAQIDSNLANGEFFVGGGHGMKGQGDFKADFKGNKIDLSKLTDTQKNSLVDLEKEQLNLKNDLAKLLVDQKLITQVQADSFKTKVDAEIASLSTTNITNKFFGDGFGGMNLLQGVTLTDAQKTALLGWTSKSAAVQKKIVTLYKDAGVITQAQADKINSQIDAKAADPLAFTNMGKGRMGEGGMGGNRGGHGKGFDRGTNNTTTPGSATQTSGAAVTQ